jgi:hypothetical protein
MKCSGCRCSEPTTNHRCACCHRWPAQLACWRCGKLGRFDTDLLLTTAGPVHDACHAINDETIKELAACLDYARLVARVLPIDEEADRMATAALNRRDAGRKSTKLLPRKAP